MYFVQNPTVSGTNTYMLSVDALTRNQPYTVQFDVLNPVWYSAQQNTSVTNRQPIRLADVQRNNLPELSGKSWWVTLCVCFSLFFPPSPLLLLSNLHAVSLYLYTSIDLSVLVAGYISRSLTGTKAGAAVDRTCWKAQRKIG